MEEREGKGRGEDSDHMRPEGQTLRARGFYSE